MAKKIKKFQISEGEYSGDFIKLLAMAIHLELVEPSELTVLQQDGILQDQISALLKQRIIDNRNNR